VKWTKRDSGTKSDLYGVTYGNGIFVAVGAVGTKLGSPPSNGIILTSRDGVKWTKRTSEKPLGGVTYGNGIFVAVGDNGTILTSP